MIVDFKTVIPAGQAGDKTAQDALMAGFYAWSVTQVKFYARDSELAKNIAVDFWTWLFTEGGLQLYDNGKGAFLPWARNYLVGRAMNATRKRQPKVAYYSEVSDPASYDSTERMSALQDVETVVGKLRTAQHKDVFWRLIEGATASEIADELDISVKRARNLISDVRAVIVEQLREE